MKVNQYIVRLCFFCSLEQNATQPALVWVVDGALGTPLPSAAVITWMISVLVIAETGGSRAMTLSVYAAVAGESPPAQVRQ